MRWCPLPAPLRLLRIVAGAVWGSKWDGAIHRFSAGLPAQPRERHRRGWVLQLNAPAPPSPQALEVQRQGLAKEIEDLQRRAANLE